MPRSFLLKRFILKQDWGFKDRTCDLQTSEEILNYAAVKDVRGIAEVDSSLDCEASSKARIPSTGQSAQIGPLGLTGLYWTEAVLKKPSERLEICEAATLKAPGNQPSSAKNCTTAGMTDLVASNTKHSPPAKGKEQQQTVVPRKETYRCEQCGKIFKTKYTLTIHLKMPSHTGARPFVCAICGKGFRLSSTLCRHKIIHTSHKPHQCSICSKAFNRSSTLKTHQRTHSDTKEFSCHVCGKGFHQKGNLRNHLLIHTGEKPYQCSLCHKAFNKLSNLKFHSHVHTDNRPYRCRFCKITFTRRCDLKDHLATCLNQKQ